MLATRNTMIPATEYRALLDKCGELEEQVAYLKGQLGLQVGATEASKLRAGFDLTTKEVAVVLHLYETRARATTKEGVLNALYGASLDVPEIKIVDVFVCKARKKLPDGSIETIWGHGYRLTSIGVAAIEAVLGSPLADIRMQDIPEHTPLLPNLARQILEFLEANGPSTAQKIAAGVGRTVGRIHNSTGRMSRVQMYLEAVDFQPGPRGTRRAVYGLTDWGRERLREYRSAEW
jgi:hypothetical protein